ncbi:hypothetical protein [uncultured Legionella sp.]|uniref:hypothetical protein n=1 Tax=uncultured Legionella sp. TaxID=210934 RepID=UPI002637BA95|nr:hypothetical protein [uncultured Legionella sp.]
MAQIIKPLLRGKPFESTGHRLLSMFQPIQKTKEKESDYLAFIVTPILDYTILDAAFALDAAIHIFNATASLMAAAYYWTLNQQDSKDLLDSQTSNELDDFVDNIDYILSSFVAQLLNLTFSTASLVTRPIMSIIEAVAEDNEEDSYRLRSF